MVSDSKKTRLLDGLEVDRVSDILLWNFNGICVTLDIGEAKQAHTLLPILCKLISLFPSTEINSSSGTMWNSGMLSSSRVQIYSHAMYAGDHIRLGVEFKSCLHNPA